LFQFLLRSGQVELQLVLLFFEALAKGADLGHLVQGRFVLPVRIHLRLGDTLPPLGEGCGLSRYRCLMIDLRFCGRVRLQVGRLLKGGDLLRQHVPFVRIAHSLALYRRDFQDEVGDEGIASGSEDVFLPPIGRGSKLAAGVAFVVSQRLEQEFVRCDQLRHIFLFGLHPLRNRVDLLLLLRKVVFESGDDLLQQSDVLRVIGAGAFGRTEQGNCQHAEMDGSHGWPRQYAE